MIGRALATLTCLAAGAAAQPLHVGGRVVLAGEGSERPVVGTMVTLHRIGERAGPVDSARTDAQGRYRFAVASPDSQAMYLATARYAGIAYFAPPVRSGDAPGAPGEIHMFDTTAAAIPLRRVGRHLVVSAPGPRGMREVVEVLELGNEGFRTRVSTPGTPVFVARVPRQASRVRSTQGDFAGAGSEVVPGAVRVVAPFAPGLRQLVLTYDLPPSAFPLTVALDDSTAVVEVLLEEATATVDGAGLQAVGAVPSEGRNFLRFLGNEVAPGSLTVRVQASAPTAATWPWLLGLGIASALALAWAMRPGRAPSVPTGTPALTEGLRLQATIDALERQLASGELSPADHGQLEAHIRGAREALGALDHGEAPR